MLKRHIVFQKGPIKFLAWDFFQCKGIGKCIKICAKLEFSLKKAPSDYWPEISLL